MNCGNFVGIWCVHDGYYTVCGTAQAGKVGWPALKYISTSSCCYGIIVLISNYNFNLNSDPTQSINIRSARKPQLTLLYSVCVFIYVGTLVRLMPQSGHKVRIDWCVTIACANASRKGWGAFLWHSIGLGKVYVWKIGRLRVRNPSLRQSEVIT